MTILRCLSAALILLAWTASSPAEVMQKKAPNLEVTYLDSQKVAAAFAKGAPLLETPMYKVHASRREKSGEAEIHTRETDVIYVLEGTAAFVTGGAVSGVKGISPGELRGKEIQGGVSHRLKKGDVIVVPYGVPHWFKEVKAPFLYFVVKALLMTRIDPKKIKAMVEENKQNLAPTPSPPR